MDNEKKIKIKILIAEDSKLTIVGLKTMFKNHEEIELLDIAENGKIAVAMTQELNPDIILMDLSMPVMDGIEATREIKKLKLNSKVIILTSHENKKEVFDAFSAGASSYCMKDIEPETLINVIKTTHQGASWLDPKIAQVVIGSLSEEKQKSLDNTELTDREIEVLKLISKGCSNNQIAEELFISLNTVKTHIKNIFQKLEVEDRTHAAMKALNQGVLENQ